MARRKEARYTTLYLQDGTGGSGAVNDAALVATDTNMGIDTLVMNDSVTLIPVGTRFVTAGIVDIRTVSAANNSQQWTITIDATGGTFDIVLNGETAATIAYDATSATIQTALEALASITAGDVTVAGDGPHTVTMAVTFANIATNTLTTVATSLTGGAQTAVVAVVQDGTDTWDVTFTPAIATGFVPADDAVITWLPQRVEIVPEGTGTGNWTEAKDPQIKFSRELIDGVTAGPEVPLQFNTTMVLDWFRASSGGALTPYEAINKLGEAVDWLTSAGVRTGGSFCEPFCVDVVMVDSPPCGSEQAEVTIIRSFYDTALSPSLEDSQIDLSGISPSTRAESFRVANNANAIGVIV
jgi:hypothetical protein